MNKNDLTVREKAALREELKLPSIDITSGPIIPDAKHRLKVFRVTQDDILAMFCWNVQSKATYSHQAGELQKLREAIPKDAEVVSVHFNHECRTFDFTVRHHSFAEVPPGSMLPVHGEEKRDDGIRVWKYPLGNEAMRQTIEQVASQMTDRQNILVPCDARTGKPMVEIEGGVHDVIGYDENKLPHVYNYVEKYKTYAIDTAALIQAATPRTALIGAHRDWDWERGDNLKRVVDSAVTDICKFRGVKSGKFIVSMNETTLRSYTKKYAGGFYCKAEPATLPSVINGREIVIDETLKDGELFVYVDPDYPIETRGCGIDAVIKIKGDGCLDTYVSSICLGCEKCDGKASLDVGALVKNTPGRVRLLDEKSRVIGFVEHLHASTGVVIADIHEDYKNGHTVATIHKAYGNAELWDRGPFDAKKLLMKDDGSHTIHVGEEIEPGVVARAFGQDEVRLGLDIPSGDPIEEKSEGDALMDFFKS